MVGLVPGPSTMSLACVLTQSASALNQEGRHGAMPRLGRRYRAHSTTSRPSWHSPSSPQRTSPTSTRSSKYSRTRPFFRMTHTGGCTVPLQRSSATTLPKHASSFSRTIIPVTSGCWRVFWRRRGCWFRTRLLIRIQFTSAIVS
ncbi:hypothetical protein C8J57DRAFT_1373967 [Mycena rebaudengoi]|nr:hypothetical protein C8J57DRAFT_1373967 [Mycena rebaudengoi]